MGRVCVRFRQQAGERLYGGRRNCARRQRSIVTGSRDQRHEIERQHFDSLAHEAASEGPVNETLSPVLIEKHVEPRLGDIAGRYVVECGCGTGRLLVRIAERGARAYGFDLSDGMIALARARVESEAPDGDVVLSTMTLEQMTYEPEMFDLVVGVAVLHHADLGRSRYEVHRVLKPGGRAVFFEPLRGNPAVALYRALTPNLRTPTEVPLSLEDIGFFADPFSRVVFSGLYLTGLISLALLAMFRSRAIFDTACRITDPLDRALIAVFPALRRYCGFAMIEVVK